MKLRPKTPGSLSSIIAFDDKSINQNIFSVRDFAQRLRNGFNREKIQRFLSTQN